MADEEDHGHLCVVADITLTIMATENARHESTGHSKMRDMNLRHQYARVEIAGHENAGPVSMESQSVKKCLKVVVFVCRVIPLV